MNAARADMQRKLANKLAGIKLERLQSHLAKHLLRHNYLWKFLIMKQKAENLRAAGCSWIITGLLYLMQPAGWERRR